MAADRWDLSGDASLLIGVGGAGLVVGASEAEVPTPVVSVRWTGRAVELRALDDRQRPQVNGQAVVHARVKVGRDFIVAGHRFFVPGPAELGADVPVAAAVPTASAPVSADPAPPTFHAPPTVAGSPVPSAPPAEPPSEPRPEPPPASPTVAAAPPTFEPPPPAQPKRAPAPPTVDAAPPTFSFGRWQLLPDQSMSVTLDPQGRVTLSDPDDGPGIATVRWSDGGVELRSVPGVERPFVDGQPVVHARLAAGRRFVVAGAAFDVLEPGVVSRVDSAGAVPTHPGPPTQPQQPPPQQPPPQQPPLPPSGAHSWQLPQKTRLTIGREGGPAEIPLSGLDLAKRHATVEWTGRAVEVRSLTAQARPFVNGKPVLHARVPVGGEFMIGNHTLVVTAPGVLTLESVRVDAAGPLLRFDDVSLIYRGRSEATLKNMSFELAAGEVLAVIGPSGAGKSTLCGGLLGEIGVQSGTMLLGQANLGAARNQASHLVSFVPQQPAMVENLSVQESLNWVARLRLASDVKRQERNARVESVIAAMELTNDTKKKVSELSGGQRKRVSTAMELLSDPLLLVLDEPTSGLDEGLDRKMMDSLQDTAKTGGRAVIVVTHSMVNIDRADKVLALTRTGRLAYFGPPEGLLRAFGAANYAEVMDQLRANKITDVLPQVSRVQAPAADVTRPRTRSSLVRHLPKLVGRELARQRNGALNLTLSLLGGVLLTALLSAAASADGLSTITGNSAMLIAFIVCLTFFSMAQSFAAIVDDRAVIEREARWSISATSVVLARALTCAPLALALGALSTLLYLLIKDKEPVDPVLPHPTGLLLFAVLLPLAAMSLGLLISTLSKSLRQAVFILMGVLALQVVMTGLAPKFEGAPGEVMKVIAILTPSRWTSAGLGANHGIGEDVYLDPQTRQVLTEPTPFGVVQDSPYTDDIWMHDSLHVFGAAAALVAISVVALVLATWILRRQLLKIK